MSIEQLNQFLNVHANILQLQRRYRFDGKRF